MDFFKSIFTWGFRIILAIVLVSAYGGYWISETGFAANCRDNNLVKLKGIVYTCTLNPEYRQP